MCNLNIFIKTNDRFEKNGREFDDFLSAYICACSNSFVSNNDGDGYYFSDSDEVVKSENKVNLVDYRKKMFESKFVLGHQRLTTHGHGNKYIHPFVSKEFALIHNGILGNFAENGHSDTYMFFHKFLDLFNKTYYEDTSREMRIVETIKSLLDKEMGSYSIALYDKVLDKLFYFKGRSLSISFFLEDTKKSLFITTNNSNGGYFNMYKNLAFEKQPIENYIIYEIGFNEDNKIYINSKGEIECGFESDCYFDYYNYRDESSGRYTLTNGKVEDNKNNLEKITEDLKDEYGITTVNAKGMCACCSRETNNFHTDSGEFFCDYCIEGDVPTEFIEDKELKEQYYKEMIS